MGLGITQVTKTEEEEKLSTVRQSVCNGLVVVKDTITKTSRWQSIKGTGQVKNKLPAIRGSGQVVAEVPNTEADLPAMK